MEELLEELQRLLGSRNRSEPALDDLVALLQLVAELDPRVLERRLWPELVARWRGWPEPMAQTPDGLERWLERCRSLPFLELTWVPAFLEASTTRRITRDPSLSQLRVLDLSQLPWSTDQELVEILLASPHLGGCHTLRTHLATPEAISALPTGLHTLRLSQAWLGERGGACLAQRPFHRLATLDLVGCGLSDAGVAGLLEAPWLHTLRELDLSLNAIGPGGAQHLASCAGLSGLEVLRLDDNRLYEEGARRLAESPHLRQLRELKIHRSGIGPQGARHIAGSATLPEAIRRFFHDTAHGYYETAWE